MGSSRPWWSEARDPWRPAEPLAGISADRSCRRKTARPLQEALTVDLGTRNVDFSSSLSLVCEKIKSSHTSQHFCAVLIQDHIQLCISFTHSFQLRANNCLQDVCCLDILFFKDFQHPISLSISPLPGSVTPSTVSIFTRLADQSSLLIRHAIYL